MSETVQRRPAADKPSDRLGPRQWATLLGVVLLALLPGFFSTPVMDRDEARYSQAATQMMETGDFVDIRFQNEARHVKPAGIYWMQVVTAAPFGGADAPIWAFRLPSLFGILIACAATAWLGARTMSPAVGTTAGLLLGLTFAVAIEARTAKTDAMLLASAAVAQTALYFILVRMREFPRPAFRGWPLLFWAATGAAIMIKGPIVTMVSATTVAAYGVWMRDRGVIGRLRPLPGLAVAAAIALPWLIAITIRTDGAFFAESVGHALFGKVAESDDSHAGPFGYHTLLLPVTFWPGTVLLGLAGAFAWTRRQEPTVRFLLAWLLPTWVIFEFVATKLPHYVLPTFPAIALLAALGLAEAPRLLSAVWPRRIHAVLAALFGVVAIVLAILPYGFARYLGAVGATPAHLLVGAVALGVAGIGVWAAMRPSEHRRLMIGAGGVVVLYWALFEAAIPRLDPLWPSARVAEIVEDLEGCEEIRAATAGYKEPSNVFYLGTRTVLGADGAAAASFLASEPACGIAIVDRRERALFDATLEKANMASRVIGRVEGTNIVKGRELSLDLLVTETSPLRFARD